MSLPVGRVSCSESEARESGSPGGGFGSAKVTEVSNHVAKIDGRILSTIWGQCGALDSLAYL